MAGMKRFVTYIYSYENHVKGANAGFAKFEIRGEECRIEIHLRGFIGRTTCKIYLFRLEDGNMEGVEIGELGIMNGAGDFRILLPAKKICASPYGIFDMEGIVIFSEDDRMFLSRWTEGAAFEAAKENFHVWKPPVEPQADRTPVQETGDRAKENPDVAIETESEDRQDTDQMQDSEQIRESEQERNPGQMQKSEQEQNPKQIQKLEQEQNPGQVQNRRQAQPQEDVQPPEAAFQAEDPVENVTATELPMQNIFPQYTWQEIWENLQVSHPLYQPFENTEIQCLRIELKDLRELPGKYWHLGNNSFLLHGFFNYHYLILGKEKNNYFIGIPGIFQRQEHVMATIFGFPEFLPTMLNKKEKANTEPVNRFGFWFRYMDE